MGQKAREKREPREKGRPEPRPGMRRRRKKWILGNLVALVLIGGGVGAWIWNGARATPAEPAPRFNLWASSGRAITLDDYVGKREVVLFFFMGAG